MCRCRDADVVRLQAYDAPRQMAQIEQGHRRLGLGVKGHPLCVPARVLIGLRALSRGGRSPRRGGTSRPRAALSEARILRSIPSVVTVPPMRRQHSVGSPGRRQLISSPRFREVAGPTEPTNKSSSRALLGPASDGRTPWTVEGCGGICAPAEVASRLLWPADATAGRTRDGYAWRTLVTVGGVISTAVSLATLFNFWVPLSRAAPVQPRRPSPTAFRRRMDESELMMSRN
jgi:hypothetical protein